MFIKKIKKLIPKLDFHDARGNEKHVIYFEWPKGKPIIFPQLSRNRGTFPPQISLKKGMFFC